MTWSLQKYISLKRRINHPWECGAPAVWGLRNQDWNIKAGSVGRRGSRTAPSRLSEQPEEPLGWGHFLCKRAWQEARWESPERALFGMRVGVWSQDRLLVVWAKWENQLPKGRPQEALNLDMSLESGLAFCLGELMGLVCWVNSMTAAHQGRGEQYREEAISSLCWQLPCFRLLWCSWSKHLVNPSLDLSQLRKAGSFLSALWNHSEENCYSARGHSNLSCMNPVPWQPSPIFLAPWTGFVEDNFFHSLSGGMVWEWFKCTKFIMHFILNIITSAPPQIIRL